MTSDPHPKEANQSIEDVLASIRNTLQQERAVDGAQEPSHDDDEDDMLVLSPAMQEEVAQQPQSSTPDIGQKQISGHGTHLGSINQQQGSPAETLGHSAAVAHQNSASAPSDDQDDETEPNFPVVHAKQTDLTKKAKPMSDSLPIPLSEEAISDTSSSFAVLQKTLQEKYLKDYEERKVAVTNEGSLTVEDIVRQEVRAFLKKWLNANLPTIVQAAVREEVERLTQRGI
ncbi:MAG: DUF2497 domain-containing protein [Acetobacter cibinongensis]